MNNYPAWTPTFCEYERERIRREKFEKLLLRWAIALIIASSIILSLWELATASDYKVIHEDDEQITSLHHFTHYEYPNVITIIKSENKSTAKEKIEVLFIKCDNWKIATVDVKEMAPYLKDEEKLKNWPVEPIEFKKGTLGAELFLHFCSQLHRRSKWEKP